MILELEHILQTTAKIGTRTIIASNRLRKRSISTINRVLHARMHKNPYLIIESIRYASGCAGGSSTHFRFEATKPVFEVPRSLGRFTCLVIAMRPQWIETPRNGVLVPSNMG